MNTPSENPTKLLLHACCGPCSMEPVRLMREEGLEPVIYYANSNIHPDEEYARRLETLEFWAKDESLKVIVGVYDPQAWEDTAGRIGQAARDKYGVITHEANNDPLPEGSNTCGTVAESPAEQARQARCRACYRMRFEEVARYAADHGFSQIGTTLSVSPYQYIAIIREELVRAADAAGVDACFVDYRPYYNNATQRSRDAGMYRQNYCACRFSDEEAQVEREMRKQARKAAKAARKAAKAAEAAASTGAATSAHKTEANSLG